MKKSTLLIIMSFISIMLPKALDAQNVGVGTLNPQSTLHLEGDTMDENPVLQVNANYANFTNLFDVIGVQSNSIITDGWGIGGAFLGGYTGINAGALAGNYPGPAYGIIGTASGSAGTRIGVFGSACCTGDDWAGYFDGRGKFTENVFLDQQLFVSDDINAQQSLYVSDTLFGTRILTPLFSNSMYIESKRDLVLRIDQPDDGGYAAAFWVRNGNNDNAFGVDEFGNARTFGHHYIDNNLGVGTQAPQSRLHVQDGDIRIQGVAPFQVINTTSPATPCGIQFRENGNVEGGLYYSASNNTLNLTTAFFNDGLVLDLDDNSIRIGPTGATGYKLSVDGKIMGEELRIMNSSDWPDYVFDDSYRLIPVDTLQRIIEAQGHLPGIPSAAEIEKEGFAVGDMQKQMLRKIEELTLYIIQQERRIKDLESKFKDRKP